MIGDESRFSRNTITHSKLQYIVIGNKVVGPTNTVPLLGKTLLPFITFVKTHREGCVEVPSNSRSIASSILFYLPL